MDDANKILIGIGAIAALGITLGLYKRSKMSSQYVRQNMKYVDSVTS